MRTIHSLVPRSAIGPGEDPFVLAASVKKRSPDERPSRCLDELVDGLPRSAAPSHSDRSLCEQRARWLVAQKGSRRHEREPRSPSGGQRLLGCLPHSRRGKTHTWRHSGRGFVVILSSQGSVVLGRVGTHGDIPGASVAGGVSEEGH
jgi:hypothetical protein